MAYTKLFSSIVNSTIWLEDDPTRIVWITMLAMADKNGEIQSSVPGLARMAGASLAATQAALDKFLAPDLHSRTTADEGRRIEVIEGGWSLLNYEKYRRMASLEEEREKNAERQRRFRERHARNGKVTPEPVDGNGTSLQRDGTFRQAEAEAEEDTERKKVSAAALPSGSPREAENPPPVPPPAPTTAPASPTARPTTVSKIAPMWVDKCYSAFQAFAKASGWKDQGFINSHVRWLIEQRLEESNGLIDPEAGVSVFTQMLSKAATAAFLYEPDGRTPKGWARLEWLVEQSNYSKLLEGGYDKLYKPGIIDKPSLRTGLQALAEAREASGSDVADAARETGDRR